MQESKRGHIWLGLGIAFFFAVCCLIVYILVVNSGPEEKNGIQYLNEDVDFVCLVYGDDYDMGELDSERVADIDTESVLRDNDYVYLIMFDLSGKGNITREDAFRLVELANKNPNFNFFYVGSSAMGFFQEARDATSQPVTDTLIWGYCYQRIDHFGQLLLWTQEDLDDPNCIPEVDIPQFIETAILGIVRENEK
ncbi:MAG: hypothetical protein IK125_00320 [Lachnospiraceae bacterium]|nr:hypothetical protein [Lachnospiraceae bacterium]